VHSKIIRTIQKYVFESGGVPGEKLMDNFVIYFYLCSSINFVINYEINLYIIAVSSCFNQGSKYKDFIQ